MAKKSKSQISATKLADSLNTATDDRLISYLVRVPKILLQEIGRHRALSLSFGSSRAIPAAKIRKQVMEDPFMPIWWGKNQGGMQAREELSGWRKWAAKRIWLLGRWAIPPVVTHWLLQHIGLHKQLCNRVLETYMMVDGVMSGTEWNNYFGLRYHPDAQPEFQELARQQYEIYHSSKPCKLQPGDWHLVLVDDEINNIMAGLINAGRPKKNINLWTVGKTALSVLKQTSAARSARASVNDFSSGKPSQARDDLALCKRLMEAQPIHASPTEHQAVALPSSERCGNFVGFRQFRKEFENESGGDYLPKLNAKLNDKENGTNDFIR